MPPEVFITNKGPYFLWSRGDEKDQAFLLGTLSSIPLDCMLDALSNSTSTFFILNPFQSHAQTATVCYGGASCNCGPSCLPRQAFFHLGNTVGVAYDPFRPTRRRYDLRTRCRSYPPYGLSESQLVHILRPFTRAGTTKRGLIACYGTSTPGEEENMNRPSFIDNRDATHLRGRWVQCWACLTTRLRNQQGDLIKCGLLPRFSVQRICPHCRSPRSCSRSAPVAGQI